MVDKEKKEWIENLILCDFSSRTEELVMK